MQNNFSDLGISTEILKAIDEMGFVEPTLVQSEAIPNILNHEDVIVMSKTGSGKTAVFGIPMLQMTNPDDIAPQGLVLTPTRELAVQVDNDLKRMSKYLGHKTTVVYGQHSMNVEIAALKKGVSIVTGTPGRVFDHISQRNLNTKNIKFLVLDEADRMLDMGFLIQVVRIIKTLPQNRVTLLFSATIPPEIQRISRDFMNSPLMIEIESPTMTVDTIKQVYYRLNRNEKQTQLNRLLLIEQPQRCMIFCNTKIAVDQVHSFLTRKGIFAQALHGDIPQAKRTKTIEQFKEGYFRILVATDVAARGIHIDSLSLVVNYDVPLEKDSYVHRIGRTGRAGNDGLAITFVTSDDIMSLYAIEEHIGSMIEESPIPSEDYFLERKSNAGEWIEANAIKVSHNPVISSISKTKSESPKKPKAISKSTPISNEKNPVVSDATNERFKSRNQNDAKSKNISEKSMSDKPNKNTLSENTTRQTSSSNAPATRRAHFRSFGDNEDSSSSPNANSFTNPSNANSITRSPVSKAVKTTSHNNPADKANPVPTSQTNAKFNNNNNNRINSKNDSNINNNNNNSNSINNNIVNKTDPKSTVSKSVKTESPENPHFLKRIFNSIFKSSQKTD